ncbi:hypothetical protein CcaverHIS002_0112880 [Cutaneotrichosporon cavernicola]|nr:hypothetical protein CcaverHIS002_0112880 [Cutaneotrichosporon cavernicola]
MSSSPLSNYSLGDLLGRGASANVYRALNFQTGETVAIKQISVASLPASSVPDIMSEIDLLKNLNHPNIVKYKGFARDKENLFIVLEYCENGSLQNILKRYGKFPESLVAVYMRQVLEGLLYLHDQGVIHRDIKGANILTNKDGCVKLADFGVSSRAPKPDLAAAAAHPDADIEVVGSPYWMAPEVIEQSGATAVSDVWSVGCVVVELLEGKPPFGNLTPMQALFRIVQDPSMRIPEGASPIVKDFLYQCFQKDPNLRVSARKLLRHPWMQTAKKGSDEPAAAVEAIQKVQAWNEALNAVPKNSGTIRRLPVLKKAKEEVKGDRSDATIAPAKPKGGQGTAGLLQKNQHVSDALSRARESDETEKWDDDFALDISLPKLTHKASPVPPEEVDTNHATVRPSRDALAASKKASKGRPQSIEEDYSDLGLEGDELKIKASIMRSQHRGRKPILHPNDLYKIGTIKPYSSKPATPPSLPSLPQAASVPPSKPPPAAPASAPQPPQPPPPPRVPSPASSPTVSVTNSPTLPTKTPPGSRQSSLRGRNASNNHLELLKYTEADDEDYSDMFGGPAANEDGTNTMGSLQLTRRSNRSWVDEDEEGVDPFAELEDDFATDSYEENLRRDRRAAKQASVERLIVRLETSIPAAQLKEVSEELLSTLENAPPDMQLERHFVQNRGMLALLDVLETHLNRRDHVRELPMSLLKIVNFIVAVDVDNLESFCLVGGIPVMIPYTSKRYHLNIRLEASTFIQNLTRSALTLQMFISCRGLKVLVDLLDEDYSVNEALILSALEGIGTLLALIKDKDADEDVTKRCLDVLLLFSQVAQADSHVRQSFAERTIMMRLLRALDLLPRKLLVTEIKAVKHLATHPQLVEVLQNSNAVEILVDLLGKTLKGSYSNEICSHIFQTIFSMCRLSKSRQEEAAAAGIIPLLKRVIMSKSQLKQFALPVLCDLANAGKQSRRLLWQNEGLNMYLDLLDDPYWRVSALEALTAWMQDEPARVEGELLSKESVDCLTKCFVQSSSQSYERILEPFLKIMRLSPPLTNAFVSPTFLTRLAETLERQTKAGITLNLLRITRLALESHPQRLALVPRYRFDRIIKRLALQNDPVLVRELAQQVYPVLVGGTLPAPSSSAMGEGKRKITAVRRKSTDMSPPLGYHGFSNSGQGIPPRRVGAHARTASDEIRRSVLGPPIENGEERASSDGRRPKSGIPRNVKEIWDAGENGRSRLRPPATPRLRALSAMSTKIRRPVAMSTPKRQVPKTPSRRDAASRQAVLDNYDLEVSHRTATKRAELDSMLSTYLSLAEAEILRIPRDLRTMTLGELEECWAGNFADTKRDAQSPLPLEKTSKSARTKKPAPAPKRRTKKAAKTPLPAATGVSTLPQDHEFNPRLPKTPARAPRRNESFFSLNGSPVNPELESESEHEDELPDPAAMEAAAERASQTSRTTSARSKAESKRAPSMIFRQSLAPTLVDESPDPGRVGIPLSDGRTLMFDPLALSPGRIDDELESGGLGSKEKAGVKKLVQEEVFRSLTERMERWKAL